MGENGTLIRISMQVTCQHCGFKREYAQEWDSYYCQVCNEWLEKKCSTGCVYCEGRPDKPIEEDMSFCEYDRKILQDVVIVLHELKEIMAEALELSKTSLSYCVNNSNKQAKIHQEHLKYHLDLMEAANEQEE